MEILNVEGSFKWDNYYLLGDEVVDEQHHKLLDMVNSLIESCENGTDKEKLKDTLDFLVNYAIEHFTYEETLQLKYNYPEYEKHKKMHAEFKMVVAGLIQEFNKTGSSSELSKDINKFILKWLIKHILHEDKKIGIYIKNINNV